MFTLWGLYQELTSPSHWLNLSLSSRSQPLLYGRPRASLMGYLEPGVFEMKEMGLTLSTIFWQGIQIGYHDFPDPLFDVAASMDIVLSAISRQTVLIQSWVSVGTLYDILWNIFRWICLLRNNLQWVVCGRAVGGGVFFSLLTVSRKEGEEEGGRKLGVSE